MERVVEVAVYAWVGAVFGGAFLIAVFFGFAAIWAILRVALYVLDRLFD